MRRGTRKALPHSTPQRSEQRSQQQDVADFFVICAAIAHATATIASSTIARRGTRQDRQAGQSGFEMRRTCDEMCACILNSAFQVGNNCNLVWSFKRVASTQGASKARTSLSMRTNGLTEDDMLAARASREGRGCAASILLALTRHASVGQAPARALFQEKSAQFVTGTGSATAGTTNSLARPSGPAVNRPGACSWQWPRGRRRYCHARGATGRSFAIICAPRYYYYRGDIAFQIPCL